MPGDYDYEPEFGGGLSNHLPMALAALSRLGAPLHRIEGFRRAYAPRLTPLGDTADAPMDPRSVLGQRRSFEAVYSFFRERVQAEGRRNVTQTWLPILMPGVAAAAFHPLIMLHYALDAENDRGVAHALAYFAWAYLPMGDFAATEHRELDFAAAVSRLASIDRAPTAAGLFSERLRREAQRPEVSAILAKLGGSGNPADAMELAVSTYYAINDLLSLHMVTACHAYQRIVELLTHEDPELRLHLLRALLVAYVACDTPKLEPIPSTTAVDWQAISERAQHDPDEHVIKIVWTCRDMQERWGTDVSALAARAVGLSDTPPA